MSFLKICLILIGVILLSSCATTYAPEGWLPSAEDIPSNTYGAWCTLTLKVPTAFKTPGQNVLMGELVAVDDSSVFLLNDILLDKIPLRNIENSVVELDKKHYEYGGHTFLGILSTASHGLLAIVTAPIWFLVGLPITVGESNRDRYVGDPPDLIYWDLVRKFSRFPQGLPDDINLNQLKTKK